METKTTKELLQLLLNNIHYLEKFGGGLCFVMSILYKNRNISYDEYLTLKTYLIMNRPKNLHFLLKGAYYWTPGKKNPRIKWLKKHIEKI